MNTHKMPLSQDIKTVAVLCFDQIQALDLTGPTDVLHCAAALMRRKRRQVLLNLHLLHPLQTQVQTSSGLILQTELLDKAAALIPDLVLVCGGEREAVLRQARDPAVVRQLQLWYQQGATLAAVCNGAFVLAATGLLKDQRVTTHWQSAQALQQLHPQLGVAAQQIFICKGQLATSAGVSSGIDLALHFVSLWWGDAIALDVAKQLVVPYRRFGSEPQLSQLLSLQHSSTDFLSCIHWICEHLSQPLDLERLAQRQHLSVRQFQRWFKQQAGINPGLMITRLRLEQAVVLLGQPELKLKQIASRCGYTSVQSFSRAFRNHYGYPPLQNTQQP